MATAAKRDEKKKEFVFLWEGKDKGGRILRGEMRAGGQAVAGTAEIVIQALTDWLAVRGIVA